MPFQYTFRSDDITTWDVDTRDLLENRDRELELYSTTIDTSFLNLNASNLTSGTVPTGRMTGAYTGITSVGTLSALQVSGSSSGDLVRITQTGSGNALVVEDSANPDSTPFVVNAGGNVGIGWSGGTITTAFGSTIQKLQAILAGSAGPQIIAGTYSADTFAPRFDFVKSRNATANTQTIVVSNDSLMDIYASGSDGTGMIPAARIAAQVDGTPGTNDMPGRLIFSTTADGASTPTERMRITSAGLVGIGTSSPTVRLEVRGSTTISSQTNVAATFGTTTSGRLLVGSITGNTPFIGSEGATNLVFTTNATERMRITSAGLVGIGTNSPSYALHISRGTASVEDVAMAVDVLGGNIGDSAGCVMRAVNTNELGAIRSFVESSYLSSMRFYTAGATNVLSERMCITSAGSVGINTVSPAHTLDVNGTTRVTTGIVSGIGISYPGCTTGGGTANNMGLTWSNPNILGTVDNAVSAVLGTVSDRRFKANIETLQDGLSTVKQLRPVTYNPLDVIGFDEKGEIIIGDNDPYDTVEGFVADEVEQVAPWLVLGGENGGYQSVNYALITPMLVRAVQELEQRLTELETV